MRWSELTLSRQVTVLILAGIVVMEAISVGLDIHQITAAREAEIRNRGMAFISEALPVLLEAPMNERQDIAGKFVNSERDVSVGGAAAATDLPGGERYHAVGSRILTALRADGLAVADVIAADQPATIGAGGVFSGLSRPAGQEVVPPPAQYLSQEARVSVFSVRMEDGTDWYNFYLLIAPDRFWAVFVARSLDTVVAFVLVIGLACVVRRVMRPVGALAAGAERLGRGENVDALPVAGSADVRTMIVSFNRMSARIKQTLDYQMSLLGSLGHDLKGPLAGARRAASGIHPEDARDSVLKQLGKTDDIVAAVARYARETRKDGETTPVDLTSLLLTVADEQLEAGHDVVFEPRSRAVVMGRHVALMRAFRNLLENAIKYGSRAELSLMLDGSSAVVHIDDEGPGIDPDKAEAAFRPFERLGACAPGSGLGLAIVRTIIVDHGGTVTLEPRSSGGLRATVNLPLQGLLSRAGRRIPDPRRSE